jgi:hypothetical protein
MSSDSGYQSVPYPDKYNDTERSFKSQKKTGGRRQTTEHSRKRAERSRSSRCRVKSGNLEFKLEKETRIHLARPVAATKSEALNPKS